jgi:uncharacterized protein YpuA (DUF1002 family)
LLTETVKNTKTDTHNIMKQSGEVNKKPGENITETNVTKTNERTLDGLPPLDRQKIQNSLNESNQQFLDKLLNLKY